MWMPDVTVGFVYRAASTILSPFIWLKGNAQASQNSNDDSTQHRVEGTDPIFQRVLQEGVRLNAWAHDSFRFHIFEITSLRSVPDVRSLL